jgi:superfamily I DNA and/or RNA helicase
VLLTLFLDKQFRSHPKLMEFCAKAIYCGRLKTGIDASLRPPLAGFEWPRLSVPVAFLEIGAGGGGGGGGGGEEKDGDSKLNKGEAARVLDVLEEVLNAGELKVENVGVVTPYVAQVCR